MRLTPITADVLMLLAAAIWGFGFIAQKEAMDTVGPLTFTARSCPSGSSFRGSILLPLPKIGRSKG
jgi:drug/metabolite transporter (DMT)-like permease